MNAASRMKIDTWREMIDRRLGHWIDKTDPESLYEPMRYAVTAGGKKLRPVLLLLFAEAVDGDAESVLDAAVAVELVHDFSLVHDDIMDHDELRRGRPTVHKHWDENTAILAGDCLLVQAFRALAAVSSPHLPLALKRFAEDIIGVCEGQAFDKSFETAEIVTLEQYDTMIRLKTGCLFGLSCELGALLVDGSPQQLKAANRYGHELGFAFQIQDDLLDLVAAQEVLGKDVGSDLKEGKKTFLLLHARENATPEIRRQLDGYLRKADLSDEDIRNVIDLFKSAGTLQATQQRVEHALDQARSALELFPASPARRVLFELIQMVAERQA
ncbi:polyprenyl synthetase family protein [candidate division KSB1 bacterium]|nr:polyprenyl synthetase family protein [candidate division KSB1 bacterium]